VQAGETVEVEVEEGGQVEWRPAQVRRIIPGASGRFTACVLLDDGNPDEEFVECYDAAQKDAEWRKVRSKAEIAREKREAAAAAKREATAAVAAAAAEGSRQGRLREAPKPPPTAAAAAAAAATGKKAAKVLPRSQPAHEAVEAASRSWREVQMKPLLRQLKPSKQRDERKLHEALLELGQEIEEQADAANQGAQTRAWSAAMVRLYRDVHAPPEEEVAPGEDAALEEEAALEAAPEAAEDGVEVSGGSGGGDNDDGGGGGGGGGGSGVGEGMDVERAGENGTEGGGGDEGESSNVEPARSQRQSGRRCA